ncbi:MAG: CheR family methyltransferase [Thermoanaerobaculia bacterium]
MTEGSFKDVEAFRTAIAERIGLAFDEGKMPELAALLSERMSSTGCHRFGDYLALLGSRAASRQEWQVLAARLTVGETFFFRNPNQLRVLVEVAVPELLQADRPRREIRILSAGCAAGDEPYTLALLLQDLEKALPSLEFSIRAVDVNVQSLERAREGRYSQWSLRQTPPEVIERCFKLDGGVRCLDPESRSRVSFEELNLADPELGFWAPGAFDVIFCRNVLMYFSPEVARRVVALMAQALIPGGYLFLGHAETLRGVSEAFRLVQSHETFYYQRRPAGGETPELDRSVEGDRPPPPHATVSPRPVPDADWCATIHKAAERVAALARTSAGERPYEVGAGAAGPESGAAKDAAASSIELGPARTALEAERFGEALDLLSRLPREAETDPEALLLRAAVLTSRSELAAAKRILDSLLGLDQLNPGAHYLMALCCQELGEDGKAVEHYRSAIYLDPGFAMPYLQMGRWARRRGDLEAARRDLRQAFELLHREDTARILLFGGGFHRSALLGLCRAELRALGDEP